MNEMDSEVANLLDQPNWHSERRRLREIILGCALEEKVKWGKLCYTFEGHNVAIVYGLENYCAVGFFKGALLEDDENVLVSPGQHSQAMRQIRFSGLEDIVGREDTLVRYIRNAIEAEKSGLEVDFAEKDNLSYPEELTAAFAGDPEFSTAFEKLTPGRRRGYVIHFSGARQSKTRISRIEKCKPIILDGKGLHDQ